MDLSLSLPSLCCCDCCTSTGSWHILDEDGDPLATEDGDPLEQEAAP